MTVYFQLLFFSTLCGPYGCRPWVYLHSGILFRSKKKLCFLAVHCNLDRAEGEHAKQNESKGKEKLLNEGTEGAIVRKLQWPIKALPEH